MMFTNKIAREPHDTSDNEVNKHKQPTKPRAKLYEDS